MVSIAYFSKIAEKGCSDERLINMAKALGNKDATKPSDFILALANLQKMCQADNLKMSDYGIDKNRFNEFAKLAKEQSPGSFALDPCDLTVKDVEDIYTLSYK